MDTVHIIDKVRWLAGSEIKAVYAPLLAGFDLRNGRRYSGSILLTLKNKIIVSLFFLAPSWGIRDQTTKIVGTEGVINSAYGERVIVGRKNWREFDFYGKNSPPSFEHNLKGFENELRSFAYSIRQNKQPTVSLYDGKKAVEIVMAMAQSNKSGKVISLD
jgi:predicted dehydrogenase